MVQDADSICGAGLPALTAFSRWHAPKVFHSRYMCMTCTALHDMQMPPCTRQAAYKCTQGLVVLLPVVDMPAILHASHPTKTRQTHAIDAILARSYV